MKVTRYRCVTDTATTDQVDLEWAVLESALTTIDRRAGKDGPGWSPASFHPGSVRNDSSVIELCALVLDIDKQPDGSPLTEQGARAALSRLKGLGLRFIVHTSHSHDPTAGRYSLRAVIELDRPVPKAEWRRFYRAAAQHLGFHVEPKCLNESRFWYLPSAAPDAPALARSVPGASLEVAGILAAAAPSTSDTLQVDLEPAHYPPATPEVLAAARTALEQHGPAVQGQQGDAHTLAAAMKLRHDFGLSDQEAFALLLVWNLTCVPPWSEGELRAKSRDSYGHATGAYGSARERLPGGLFAPLPFDPKHPGDDSSALLELPSHEPLVVTGVPLASEIASVDRPPLKVFETGYPALDERMGGGWATRTLSAIVARTGAGKSGFVVAAARHVVDRYIGTPFLWGSTELDREECLARIAAQIIGCTTRDIMLGVVPRERAQAAVGGLLIHVLGSEDMGRGQSGLEAFSDSIKRVADHHGTSPVVALDYLQNMALVTEDDQTSVRMGVSSIADRLRRVAQDTDSAILAVSSTGRGFYKTPKEGADDPLTYLGAAKESGDVEFAVANLVFLDVSAERQADGTQNARIVLAKARAGNVGFVGAKFHGASGRWQPDKAALDLMTPPPKLDGKSSGHVGGSPAMLESKILQIVRDSAQPMSGNEIQVMCKGYRRQEVLETILSMTKMCKPAKLIKNGGKIYLPGNAEPIDE